MIEKIRFSRWLVGAVILAVAECAGVTAIGLSFTNKAQAQFFDDRFSRPRPRGGFLDGLFGPSQRQYIDTDPSSQGPSDSSKAPSPRKADPRAEPVTPTTSVVVMGDGMADWLAYGLEDTFANSPEIAIIRKNKVHSGLLHYDAKGDLDWWHVARDLLAQEKPSYVIMMLGVSDRQNISGKDLAKEADKKEADKKKTKEQQPDAAKTDANKTDADKTAQKDSTPEKESEEADTPSIIAPEPQGGRRGAGGVEFRTDKWAEIYARRIDETIAALKSKGVPVFWVGLPAIKGTRSTADAVYLNDLFRGRAEKAGAIYIDVWDGFVDEGGKFTTNGPDYEGQVRRLRSFDGVYFTKFGARKLAHYVERELRRTMNNRSLQVSFPSGPVPALPADAKSTVRPLAGPVVPLTTTPGNSEELLGGAGNASVRGDALATQVLVKGEPVASAPGRADDFAWRGDINPAQPVAALPVSAPVETPAAADKKPADVKAAKGAQNAEAKRRQQNNAPRPPQPVRPGSPGWLR